MGHDSSRPVWPAQLSEEIGNISWRLSCGSKLTVFRKRGPKLSDPTTPSQGSFPERNRFLDGSNDVAQGLGYWGGLDDSLLGSVVGRASSREIPPGTRFSLWNSEPQTEQYDTMLPKARNYSFSVYTSWCHQGLSLGPSGLPPFHGYNHHPYAHVSQGWTPAVFSSRSQSNTP